MLIKDKKFVAPTDYKGVLVLAASKDMIEDRKLNPVHVLAAIANSDTGAGNFLHDFGVQAFFAGKAIERMKPYLPAQTSTRKVSKSFVEMEEQAELLASGPMVDGERTVLVIDLLKAVFMVDDIRINKFLEFASPHDTPVTRTMIMIRLLEV